MRPSRNMATMMGATSMMQCDESCGGEGKGLGWVERDEWVATQSKRSTVGWDEWPPLQSISKGLALPDLLGTYLVDAHLDGEERGQRGHVGDERLLRLLDDGAEAKWWWGMYVYRGQPRHPNTIMAIGLSRLVPPTTARVLSLPPSPVAPVAAEGLLEVLHPGDAPLDKDLVLDVPEHRRLQQLLPTVQPGAALRRGLGNGWMVGWS